MQGSPSTSTRDGHNTVNVPRKVWRSGSGVARGFGSAEGAAERVGDGSSRTRSGPEHAHKVRLTANTRAGLPNLMARVLLRDLDDGLLERDDPAEEVDVARPQGASSPHRSPVSM